MGNKRECPICKSYSSDVLNGFEKDGKCPFCKTSVEFVEKHEAIILEAKILKQTQISKDIVKENEDLKICLIKKEEKNRQLEDFCIQVQIDLDNMLEKLDRVNYKKWM